MTLPLLREKRRCLCWDWQSTTTNTVSTPSHCFQNRLVIGCCGADVTHPETVRDPQFAATRKEFGMLRAVALSVSRTDRLGSCLVSKGGSFQSVVSSSRIWRLRAWDRSGQLLRSPQRRSGALPGTGLGFWREGEKILLDWVSQNLWCVSLSFCQNKFYIEFDSH